MSLKELNIKRSYRSMDYYSTIPRDLIIPCLSQSILYQRSVGYFSSSVFECIYEGIEGLMKNNGKIDLITTPMLSKEDIDAINMGLISKQEFIENTFTKNFEDEIAELSDQNLVLLARLVAKGSLNIKIVTTKNHGEYHDKLGIITDKEDNKIVFFGSSNASKNGYINNYEKIRVSRSWVDSEIETIVDECMEFDSLWNDENMFLDVMDFSSAARKGILKVVEERDLSVNIDSNENGKNEVIKLRDYQEQAINSWANNGYNGFFVMATGTGKTFTAIYGLKQLLEIENKVIVIIAPYKHLIKQWCVDLEKVFPEAKIIMAFSENAKWEDQIKTEVFRSNINKNHKLIIVSTMISFQMERFENALKKLKKGRVLVVDEAHRFTNRNDDLKILYQNMLGLSATPTNGKNIQESNDLVDFFGGVVFNLPIEKALADKHLIPYNYYPIIVSATGEDEEEFHSISQQMASCFKDNKCIDKEKLFRLSRSRLRLISNSENKINAVEDIVVNKIPNKDHMVVYCGDGNLFRDEEDEMRYINYVKDILNKNGFKTSQFTSSENMNDRMERIELFNLGLVDSLVAIRCLDEGINIPSIKTALILSSNDDLKEFVQRRGRILRKHPIKEFADIYDVVVLPSTMTPGMAKIELRRMYEYGRLSMNFENELSDKINNLLVYYNIKKEEIIINDEFFEEDFGDE